MAGVDVVVKDLPLQRNVWVSIGDSDSIACYVWHRGCQLLSANRRRHRKGAGADSGGQVAFYCCQIDVSISLQGDSGFDRHVATSKLAGFHQLCELGVHSFEVALVPMQHCVVSSFAIGALVASRVSPTGGELADMRAVALIVRRHCGDWRWCWRCCWCWRWCCGGRRLRTANASTKLRILFFPRGKIKFHKAF